MSHPPHNSTAPVASAEFAGQEFSQDEQGLLLRLAHDSIASVLEHRELSLDPPSAHFAELRGAFTSLYRNGELRGCVGYVLPACPLYRAVAETASAAGFHDNRFPPVTQVELPDLKVELSILSPPRPIQPEDVEIGRHGLLINYHGHRGLLLPQVAVEHNWDRLTFLEQTCRKAGLPLDAWKKGATLQGFAAEIFGEKELRTTPA